MTDSSDHTVKNMISDGARFQMGAEAAKKIACVDQKLN